MSIVQCTTSIETDTENGKLFECYEVLLVTTMIKHYFFPFIQGIFASFNEKLSGNLLTLELIKTYWEIPYKNMTMTLYLYTVFTAYILRMC